ncbi:MAG: hypothetical protein JWL64_1118 [Frankiales bacterium]|nr:hypothetical protein [Frankiales bacterium]
MRGMSTSPRSLGRTLAIYSGLRLALFVGFFGVCLVFRLHTPLAIVVALVASAVAGALLLREQRDQLTAAFQERTVRRQADRDRRRAALDDA